MHYFYIYRAVSAEIPDPLNSLTEDLHATVIRHMVHGPCGSANTKSPCMLNGKCTKRYPKDFCAQTRVGSDAYPSYRRRSAEAGGHVGLKKFRGREHAITNCDIVPYNPYLLVKFNCHLNVEYCASIKAVKYLYKYIFKGSDQATISIERDSENVCAQIGSNDDDEVKRYEQCRYIGASEAAFRIFRFPIQERHPAVMSLAVHLPNQQRVAFDPNFAENALQRAEKTQLTAFFATNQSDESARKIPYPDFPEHFTFNEQSKMWKRRARPKNGTPEMIGRVFTVHPNQGDVFYLRMLLHHTAGSRSYEELRTVEGTVCETFKKACEKLNLLENDKEWESCMQEAALTQSSSQLRGLFVIILVFCSPAQPAALFEQFADQLGEDFKQNHENSDDEPLITRNNVLADLARRLLGHGKTVEQVGLPSQGKSNLFNLGDADDDFLHANEIPSTASLNTEQAEIYTELKDLLEQRMGGLYFIDAPGGTGKTYLLNTLLSFAAHIGAVAVASASSGIAASLLKIGRTAHSQFKLPIPPEANSTCGFTPRDATGKLLKTASLLVWDEAPMAHRYLFEALDTWLRDLMQIDEPFGRKLIVLSGDFRQILPVVRRGQRPNIVEACITRSPLWSQFKIRSLRQNMRIANLVNNGDEVRAARCQGYGEWLLDLGDGKLLPPRNAPFPDIIVLPSEICCQSEEDVVDHVYGDLQEENNCVCAKWLSKRGLLTTTNRHAEKLNDLVMSRLAGPPTILRSADSVADENQVVHYPQEFLNSLQVSGLPPHNLSLKVNAVIMLLRNLDPKNGFCNGTRLILTSISQKLLTAKMLVGERAGAQILIPRITLSPTDTDWPFRLRRLQFPVRAAYAMTINKAQGQSLEYAGGVLPTSVFQHGQLYVLASRVGDPDRLRLFVNREEGIWQPPEDVDVYFTRNVVYPEVLIAAG
jgi:ATP-dependent DNA helicase PIF1